MAAVPSEQGGARFRWVERWYPAYGLMGASTEGMFSILLPLAAFRLGGAAHTGLVMATINLGWLLAPLWGALADRLRIHRALFAGGALAAGVALASFPVLDGQVSWLLLALAVGAGVASLNTVANLLVVEAHPKGEWDQREAWLQMFYGAGMVGGLLLAAVVSSHPDRLGLPVAGGLAVVAALWGWLSSHTPPPATASAPSHSVHAGPADAIALVPRHYGHHLSFAAIARLRRMLRSRFGLFLLVWLVANLGPAAVYALYPVLMEREFGVTPHYSAIAAAVANAAGLALYAPAGRWAVRFGAVAVLRAGIAMRVVVLLGLLMLGVTQLAGRAELALLMVGLATVAYSLLGVAGPLLTSVLTPVEEGEAMGIYMAVNAVAGMAGAALGGWAAARWGYNTAAVMGVAGTGAALLLSLPLRPRTPPPSAVVPPGAGSG